MSDRNRNFFLCFGAPRCGTTFLYHHLRAHPQIWTPPIKETYFFSKQLGEKRFNKKRREQLRENLPRLLRGSANGLEMRDRIWAFRYLFGDSTAERFCALMNSSNAPAAGNVEPTYALAGARTLEALRTTFPELKLIFVMRDPVQRSWSAIAKRWLWNLRADPKTATIGEIERVAEGKLLSASCYAEILDRWEAAFPTSPYLFLFYEDLVEHTTATLARVCHFLEVDPAPRDGSGVIGRVHGTGSSDIAIPPECERFLAERLLPDTRRIAERFGGRAIEWTERMERIVG